MNAMEKMEKARRLVMLDARFYAGLLMETELIQDPTCPTLWTDGKNIGFNPGYIDTLSLRGSFFRCIHEVEHIARKHHLRMNGREHGLYNISADAVINVDLVSMFTSDEAEDLILPGREVTYQGIKFMVPNDIGESVESAYRAVSDSFYLARGMKRQAEQDQDQHQQPGKNDQNQGKGKGQAGKGEDTDPGDTDQGQDQGTGPDPDSPIDEDKPGKGPCKDQGPDEDCEPGANGEDILDQDPGKWGEVRPSPINKADIEDEEHKIDKALIQAQASANQAGQVPGHWSRMISDMLTPAMDYESILRSWIDERARADYSWARPHKSYMQRGLIVPSLHSQEPGTIAIAIDTSGSVDEHDLNILFSHAVSIVHELGFSAWIIPVDKQVHNPFKIDKDEDVRKMFTGGGGTSFRPPFEWLEEHEEEVKGLVYLTDGECDDYPLDPGYPVLWLSIREKMNVPFGEYMLIDSKAFRGK